MRPSAAIPALVFVVTVCGFVGMGVLLVSVSGSPGGLVVSVPLGVLVGIFLASSVKVVAEWERMVVLRLGKFRDVAMPGVRFVIPIFDSTIFVEMRVQTLDIPRQQTITQDNVPVLMNAVIFFRVEDANTAALKVQNYRQAMTRYAQATLRDAVGSLTLDELLSHQERLESELARNVASASKGWGLIVEAIKIEDIDVPEDLKKMMSRQASSEREKRATIIKAEGDRMAAGALAEAAAVMSASPGAMQLRALQTIDGLGPSSSNTVLLAIPVDVFEAVKSITKRNEHEAVVIAPPASSDK